MEQEPSASRWQRCAVYFYKYTKIGVMNRAITKKYSVLIESEEGDWHRVVPGGSGRR